LAHLDQHGAALEQLPDPALAGTKRFVWPQLIVFAVDIASDQAGIAAIILGPLAHAFTILPDGSWIGHIDRQAGPVSLLDQLKVIGTSGFNSQPCWRGKGLQPRANGARAVLDLVDGGVTMGIDLDKPAVDVGAVADERNCLCHTLVSNVKLDAGEPLEHNLAINRQSVAARFLIGA
jgi:hypothetical protein